MKSRHVAIGLSVVAGFLLIPAPIANAEVPDQPARKLPRTTVVAEGEAKAAPGSAKESQGEASPRRKLKVYCEADVERPHRSGGKRHILFKTRVKCKSKDGISAVHVKVRGSLIRGQHSPQWKTVATSNETQTVAVNSKKPKTYYTPKVKGKKITASGYYHGTVSVKITAPVPGSTGHASSKIRFVS